VVATGVVFSESSLGTVARPGVFPARNRIIAALSDVVVVVESHRRGGSLYTAEAAARRSIPVCAVPGSVRSPASTGTNGLLVDGCVPVRDATDVLVAISLARAGRVDGSGVGAEAKVADDCGDNGRPTRPVSVPVAPRRNGTPDVEALDLSATERAVLGSIDDTPTAFETILIRTDLSLATAAQACDRLVERGVVREGAGWWSKS
jgi:predicted Rossmann fold nucleotide-binding protein DprA/Smf involved in DNA uptake